MSINEINAKSILRKHKRIDSWFLSCYGMNLYRGCVHDCTYCDGRAEKYCVDGDFGKDVSVKINAVELLQKELDPARKRRPFKKCFFMLGGGVGDSYQPVEKKYELTRKTLKLMYKFGHPVSALTKSTLIRRDIDLIDKINRQSGAIVSMSFSSMDEGLTNILEPGVPSPRERLSVLAEARKTGIPCGMFLLPVIPFLSDTDEHIERSIQAAKKYNLDFIIFGGMTLKDGRQKLHFYKKIRSKYPSILSAYEKIYRGNKWGAPIETYSHTLHKRFSIIAQNYRIPLRIPFRLFASILEEIDKVIVILDHIDYYLKLKGQYSSFGYAAYLISRLNKPFINAEEDIKNLNIKKNVYNVVDEILRTGTSQLYNELCEPFDESL